MKPALARPFRADGPPVDVVVTVYEALEHVRVCLESLGAHDDGFELRLIVVNDGSGPVTTRWLREAAAEWRGMLLIEHDGNQGYTRAVNTGLRASTAPWVVLLNSDTQVTQGWLAGMLRCAALDPEVGLVGPLSNAASWQSVPELFDADGGFAVNELPTGLDADGMAELVRSTSSRRYPRVALLNGFCLLLRREVLERIGVMDEALFPVGYGEENDYCLRAKDVGFELAVADDAFVFHAKSKSFGHAQRVGLTRRGAEALAAKYGRESVAELSRELKDNLGLRLARETVKTALARRRETTHGYGPAAPRILFLLPVPGASGGANSVILEAAELSLLGAFVRVAVPLRSLADLAAIYADIPDIRTLLIGASSDRVTELSRGFDVVVATAYYSMEWLARIARADPAVVPAYYVQDYEPWFGKDDEARQRAAAASYTRVPGAWLFAKTHFLARTVREKHGVEVHKVEPSLDHATYYPLERAASIEPGVVRLVAMVRPQTPRRAAPRTMRVLCELARRYAGRVEIRLFGCDGNDARFMALERGFTFVNHGALRRPEVAELLRRSDVFVDLSDYQAFGRASLEAMACGCVPVVPSAGGGAEFAVDGENSLVVDTSAELACVERIGWLVDEPEARSRMRRAALETAARFSLRKAAQSELALFTEATLARRREHPPRGARPRLALVNLSRAEGRLAVGAVLGGWKLPSVQREWDVETRARLPKPGSAEVAVVALSLEATGWDELAAWLRLWRLGGGRAVAQLQDSARLGPVALDALRWLAGAFDALTVSNEQFRQLLTPEGVEAALVPLALDPVVWGLGPAARRPAKRVRQSDALVVGLAGDAARPEIAKAITASKTAEGRRLVVESLRGAGPGAQLGNVLSPPKSSDEAALADWAFDNVRWDVAVISQHAPPGAQEWVTLELAALGIPTLKIGDDLGDAGRVLAAVVDAGVRERLVADALTALDAAQEQQDRMATAAQLLDRLLAGPRRAQPAELPRALRGFVGRFWPRWYERRFLAPDAPVSFPKARSKGRRKLDKLRRDPTAFVRDLRLLRHLEKLRRGLTRMVR